MHKKMTLLKIESFLCMKELPVSHENNADYRGVSEPKWLQALNTKQC